MEFLNFDLVPYVYYIGGVKGYDGTGFAWPWVTS